MSKAMLPASSMNDPEWGKSINPTFDSGIVDSTDFDQAVPQNNNNAGGSSKSLKQAKESAHVLLE